MGWTKQHWQKHRVKKSPFGGIIKTEAEIQALNAKIKAREKAEFDAFEAEFDQKLGEL